MCNLYRVSLKPVMALIMLKCVSIVNHHDISIWHIHFFSYLHLFIFSFTFCLFFSPPLISPPPLRCFSFLFLSLFSLSLPLFSFSSLAVCDVMGEVDMDGPKDSEGQILDPEFYPVRSCSINTGDFTD